MPEEETPGCPMERGRPVVSATYKLTRTSLALAAEKQERDPGVPSGGCHPDRANRNSCHPQVKNESRLRSAAA
jgi:hypothetical protein